MNAPRYHVYDLNDWSGTSYTMTDRDDAFAAWRSNQSQRVEMIEFVPGQAAGKVFVMNDDFEEMLIEERREARFWARHQQAYARAS